MRAINETIIDGNFSRTQKLMIWIGITAYTTSKVLTFFLL